MIKIIYVYLLVLYYIPQQNELIKNNNFSLNFPLKSIFNNYWTTSINVTIKPNNIKFDSKNHGFGFLSYLKPIVNDDYFEFDFSFNIIDQVFDKEFIKNLKPKKNTNGIFISISNNVFNSDNTHKDIIQLEGLVLFYLYNNNKEILTYKFFPNKTVISKEYLDNMINSNQEIPNKKCIIDKDNIMKVKLKIDFSTNNFNLLLLKTSKNKYESGDNIETNYDSYESCYEINDIKRYLNSYSNYFSMHTVSGDVIL